MTAACQELTLSPRRFQTIPDLSGPFLLLLGLPWGGGSAPACGPSCHRGLVMCVQVADARARPCNTVAPPIESPVVSNHWTASGSSQASQPASHPGSLDSHEAICLSIYPSIYPGISVCTACPPAMMRL